MRDSPVRSPKTAYIRLLAWIYISLLSIVTVARASLSAADDPLGPAIEAARKTRDEKQLQDLKTQLEQKIAQNPNDAGVYFDLARVQEYLVDVDEMRKDKKAAGEAVDKAIEAAQRSVQRNDKFKCIGRRRRAWCTKAELHARADSQTPK